MMRVYINKLVTQSPLSRVGCCFTLLPALSSSRPQLAGRLLALRANQRVNRDQPSNSSSGTFISSLQFGQAVTCGSKEKIQQHIQIENRR